MRASIQADGVGVRFHFDRQHRVLTPTLVPLRRGVTETWGLKDLTFSIGPGEGVALLGRSGSGKTTLLRVLAGVLAPDVGQIAISGRVGSLLSVEAGLLPPLTGRENAMLLGVLAGVPREDVARALPEIRARTRLDRHFDLPVASYSQGMRARLGLAVVVQARPQILLLDEVHEALDHESRDTIEREAHAIVRAGGIVIAAGHDHPMLARLCDRALLLSDGVVIRAGDFPAVQRSYLAGIAAAPATPGAAVDA